MKLLFFIILTSLFVSCSSSKQLKIPVKNSVAFHEINNKFPHQRWRDTLSIVGQRIKTADSATSKGQFDFPVSMIKTDVYYKTHIHCELSVLDSVHLKCPEFSDKIGNTQELIFFERMTSGESREYYHRIKVIGTKGTLVIEYKDNYENKYILRFIERATKSNLLKKFRRFNLDYHSKDWFYSGYLIGTYYSFTTKKLMTNFSNFPSDKHFEKLSKSIFYELLEEQKKEFSCP